MNLLSAFSAGVLLGCFYGYLCFSCFKEWNDFKAKRSNMNFNYHITDLWAMILAMAPTAYLGAFLADTFGAWSIFAIAAAVPSQLAWMFKGRLSVIESRSTSAIESAIMVVSFGLFGLPFTLIFMVLFTTCAPALAIYLVLYQRKNLNRSIASVRLSGRHI
jgi:hypothetical protein